MKKVLLAMDSFKGSLSAKEVCELIEKELSDEFDILSFPMADGGEGTVDAIINSRNGKYVFVNTVDHLGRNIKASYGFFDKTAVIEAASACGLELVKANERNVMKANSFGLGELILSGIDNGAEEFIIAIGGTGTNDGGYGLARALGFRFLDENGEDLPASPEALLSLKHIVPSPIDLKKYKFTIACDVKNTLCGENGASFVYGPQKGGTKEQLEHLDKCLYMFAQIIEKDLGVDVLTLEGGGAGGGISAGLVAFCGGNLKNGYSIVRDATDIEEAIKKCDAVVTGEGKTDKQTLFGKLPFGILLSSKKYNKPVALLSGRITGDGELGMKNMGLNAFFRCVDENVPFEDAINNAENNLKTAAKKLKEWLHSYI